jgi:hypothetical protein
MRPTTAASMLAVMAITSIFVAAPARAGCHLIDCVEFTYVEESQLRQHTCEQLWLLRNSIFKEAGYCFSSDKARATFGNDSCSFDDERLVPLNDYQRRNIDLFKSVEKKRGC